MSGLACTVLSASILFLLAMGGGLFVWSVCLVAGLSALTHLLLRRRRPHGACALEWVALAALAFLLMTLVPLPTALTRATGTPRYEQNRRVHEATAEAAELGLLPGPVRTFALTRNRAGTLRILMLGVAAFFALLLATTLRRRQREGFLVGLCLLGGGLAVTGAIALRVHPQGDTLWWVFPIPHGLPGPVLCFVNRNHFAGYLAMLCPPALGLFFARAARRQPLRALWPLAAFGAMTAAIALTLSRGAVVAYLGGHLVLLVLYLARRRWIPAAALLCAAGVVAVTVASLSGTTFKARMAALRAPLAPGHFDERLDAWKTCGAIWRTYPVAGAGANAFRMVFPQHRTSSRREFMLHAENEFAQGLAEGGAVAVALLAAGLAAVVHQRRRREGMRPDAPHSAVATDLVEASLWAAMAVAALHAGFDFAPRLPVYTVTAASLLGLLLEDRPVDVPWPSHRLPGRLPPLAAPVAGLLLVALLAFHAIRLRHMDAPRHMKTMTQTQLADALQGAPTSWQAWFYFGRACCRDRARPAKQLGERCITRAAALDPNNYLLWRELGHLRRGLGMTEAARDAYARAKALRYWLDVPEL